jgi:hypothetical protein
MRAAPARSSPGWGFAPASSLRRGVVVARGRVVSVRARSTAPRAAPPARAPVARRRARAPLLPGGLPPSRRGADVVPAARRPRPGPGTRAADATGGDDAIARDDGVERDRPPDEDADPDAPIAVSESAPGDVRDDAADAEAAAASSDELEGDDEYSLEGDDEYEYEYEEVEVEVDYGPLDYAADAVASLGAWEDVAAWPNRRAPAEASSDASESSDASSPTPAHPLTSPPFTPSAAVAPISAAPGGGLPMAPASGVAVALALAFGAVTGRRAAATRSEAAKDVLGDLARRAAGSGSGAPSPPALAVQTEAERVAEEKRKAERVERDRRRELERRKRRDEEEVRFVAAEKARLAREAEEEAKRRAEEEARRAKVRAELAERAEMERVMMEEKLERERVEAARREAEAEAELARRRAEEAERQKKRLAERAEKKAARGEVARAFDATITVEITHRGGGAGGVDDENRVEAKVTARCGVSAPGTRVGGFPSAADARAGCFRCASEVALEAVSAYASDQRVKAMTGDPSHVGAPDWSSGDPGRFDDVEFDHWMRLARARIDAEIRGAAQRACAGLDAKRNAARVGGMTPGEKKKRGASSSSALGETRETRVSNVTVERCSLPPSDADNVTNRLYSAARAAGDDARRVAADDVAWVARHDLAQLHGLDASLVFPAVGGEDDDNSNASSEKNAAAATNNTNTTATLKGALVATMLTLSHWLARARELAAATGGDALLVEKCDALAGSILSDAANAEGSSWKAMYLDGFGGDALTQLGAAARALLPVDDPVRAFVEAAEEERAKKLRGTPTIDEDAYPDREEARRARHRADQDAVPLAERLWAMRNAAAQMAQSGSRGQARAMLEEAYALRASAVEKAREARAEEARRRGGLGGEKAVEEAEAALAPGAVAAELLPELLALEEVFAAEASWARDLAGVRGRVLRATETAAREAAARGELLRAAALLEGAAREYGGERKLGAEHPASKRAFAEAARAWRDAGVGEEDEEAKDAALEEAAGTKVPRGGGGGIVLKLTKRYLEELEVRRR